MNALKVSDSFHLLFRDEVVHQSGLQAWPSHPNDAYGAFLPNQEATAGIPPGSYIVGSVGHSAPSLLRQTPQATLAISALEIHGERYPLF
jgi:hypothetical protein